MCRSLRSTYDLLIALGILNSAQANNILKAKAPKDPHAPKRPRGRPRKDGLPPKQAGEVETDSDSDLSVENEPELRPAFLTISMPPDFRGQSLYKATDAVWCDRNNPAPVEKVQTGIADFGNTVKAFRDSWKTKNENLKKAENENSTSAQIPLLKKDVGDDRAFMDTIMVYALRFGHPAILKRYVTTSIKPLFTMLLYRALSTECHDCDTFVDHGRLSHDESTGGWSLHEVEYRRSLLPVFACWMQEYTIDSFAVTRFVKSSKLPSHTTTTFLQHNADNFFAVSERIHGSCQPSIPSCSTESRPAISTACLSHQFSRYLISSRTHYIILILQQLAVNFNTLDEAKLEALKWSKLLQRLMKKATNESKGLAQKILSSASALTAKKKTDGDGSSPKPNGEVAGVKRAHDGSTVQPVVRKTVVKPSSKPLALQNAERRRAQEKEEAARKAKEAKEAPGSANGLSTKPKVVVPQKTNYSALMSASKRPGTTNAERAAAAKDKPTLAQPIKKEQGKRESPPRGIAAARPQTSFLGGLLGEFEKKKEVKPEKEDAAPDENPEQNAKRIRKESRRKMRVSWKADSELVQTRLFTHDPDEELGHDDSMMKDAGDTMKEGEMLKRKMGMSDLDDEDEEDESEDTYSPPSEVDFSGLPSDAQDSNGIKFGGKVKPESPSSRLQDAFEANTIMVVFDSKSERPITPKEAQDEGDDVDFQPCLDFGEPEDKVRAKERALQPQQSAGGFNLGALAQQLGQGQAAPQQPPDLSSILSNLSRQQAAPQPAAPAPAMDFSQLVANIHNMQSRPQQYAPAAPPASGQLDLSALLANYQQSNNTTLGKHSLDDAGESDKKKNKGLPANYKTQVCTFWKEGRCTKGDDCTYKHSE